MVPKVGLEPTLLRNLILSQARLPFRHSGIKMSVLFQPAAKSRPDLVWVHRGRGTNLSFSYYLVWNAKVLDYPFPTSSNARSFHVSVSLGAWVYSLHTDSILHSVRYATLPVGGAQSIRAVNSFYNKLFAVDAPGRGDRIRTCDIMLPKHARYRTALHPEETSRLFVKYHHTIFIADTDFTF